MTPCRNPVRGHVGIVFEHLTGDTLRNLKGELLHALREDVLTGDERRRKRVFDVFRAEALAARPGEYDTRFLGINWFERLRLDP